MTLTFFIQIGTKTKTFSYYIFDWNKAHIAQQTMEKPNLKMLFQCSVFLFWINLKPEKVNVHVEHKKKNHPNLDMSRLQWHVQRLSTGVG